MGSTEAVSWSVASPGILRIDLHRAPANALGLPIIAGVAAALDDADADPSIRVIVVASDLPGIFAAGADIKLMVGLDREAFAAYGDGLRAVVDRIAAPGRLSVAAVEGLALGGGLELALACSLRVAGRDAQFGLPEVKIGLVPGAGGTQRLPRLVGRGRALDIMLTGRQLGADEAHTIGLVDRLVDTGGALDEALALAGALLGSSSRAQAAIIRTVDAAFDLPIDEGKALERFEVGDQFENGDGREGLTAFLEKRRPEFS